MAVMGIGNGYQKGTFFDETWDIFHQPGTQELNILKRMDRA